MLVMLVVHEINGIRNRVIVLGVVTAIVWMKVLAVHVLPLFSFFKAFLEIVLVCVRGWHGRRRHCILIARFHYLDFDLLYLYLVKNITEITALLWFLFLQKNNLKKTESCLKFVLLFFRCQDVRFISKNIKK